MDNYKENLHNYLYATNKRFKILQDNFKILESRHNDYIDDAFKKGYHMQGSPVFSEALKISEQLHKITMKAERDKILL